ncbi:uncharacterized protein [Typha angustifolia]|uniref:uncharacterized protein n=1 Tax=Typha angustifolia TaxID=59011 RepID=UPI003C2FC727
MQSGYGGVSELQQFMVDNCGPSSLFSISSTPNPPPPNDMSSHPNKYHHPLPHHHHHHHPPPPQQQQQPPPFPPHHFAHFHSIPITQQLFQHGHHHQFQLFHHQLGLDHESGPENSSGGGSGGGGGGGGGPSFLAAAANFKLGVNDNSGGGGDDDNAILHGDDEASESRLHRGGWHREEEAAIKEPPWRPLDIDYINRNNKRCKDKEPAAIGKYCKKTKDAAAVSDHVHNTTTAGGSSNYKLFSELEAIYKPGGSASCGGGGANQTGSGSALTGDDNPLIPAAAAAAVELGPIGDRHIGVGSETSAGEDAPVNKSSKGGERRKRKRRRQQKQLGSIAAFFETLVKQLMDHQESLHRQFLDAMERRDAERSSREESWRRQEAAKSTREAAARAHDREIASAREAAIVAFLEKFTGEKIHLPSNPSPFPTDSLQNKDTPSAAAAEMGLNDGINNNNTEIIASVSAHEQQQQQFSTSRWPKAEVQALIRVRSGLDSRFQEPGLKGPLWEEVSSRMAAVGFHRSAKRCKEKWENINKYFRKTKDSGKKRPQHSKTCPYFHQLDQLYSKLPPSSSSNSGGGEHPIKDNSELLDAIVVATADNQHNGASVFGFASNDDNNDNDNDNDEEIEDDEQDNIGGGGGDGEEGEGESHDHDHEDHRNESTTLFFQHLQ